MVLTHLHGDHSGGLPFLVFDGQFRGRTSDLIVTGPPGTEARLTEAMEVLFPGSSSVQRRFDVVVREYQDRQPLHVGDLHVTPYEVRHEAGAPAYGVRVAPAMRSSPTPATPSGPTPWSTSPTTSTCSCLSATHRAL